MVMIKMMLTTPRCFVVMLFALAVGNVVSSSSSSSSSSRTLQYNVAYTANGVPVNTAGAATMLERYHYSDLAPHAGITSRHSKVQLSIAEEEPESHNLHTESIDKERTRERKREGTIKYNKKNKGGGTKGAKGDKKGSTGGGGSYSGDGSNGGGNNSTRAPSPAPKQKSVKGEKSKESNGYDGDDYGDEGDDDGGNGKYGAKGEKNGDEGDDYGGSSKNGSPKDDNYGDGDGDDDGDGDGDGDGDDDGDDDGSSPTFRATETSVAPVIAPTLSAAPKTAPPIQPPPSPLTPPTNIAVVQDSETIPKVSRLIPAFRIGYTTNQAETPDSSDYSELAAITRNFLHNTLTSHYTSVSDASVNDILYMSTELEFYFIRGVYIMEYQFKTKWGGGGNQVPSIPELNGVVKSFFDSSPQSYIAGLQTGLRPENAFSTTAGISVGSQGMNTVPDGAPPAPLEEQQENEGSSSKVSRNIIIPVTVIAGAACVLVLFVFFRHRKVAPTGSVASRESESLKPDEDYTLDTAPMRSISASIMRKPDPRRPDPRRFSSGKMVQNSSIYMESDEELIDQNEHGFEEVPIDHLAEV